MSISRSSRIGSRPQVRRVSRHELEEIFPTTSRRLSRKSVSSQQTNRRNTARSDQCRTPSDLRRISFQEQRKSSIQQQSNEQQIEPNLKSHSKKRKFFK